MITRRGKIVRALAILAGLIALLWLAGHLWYTGAGYCIGSMSECIGL